MRRLALAACLALTAASPAAAAAEAPHLRSAAKAFPFLTEYYRLEPAQRSRFALAYRFVEKTKAETPVKVTLLDGGAEATLPTSPDGWLVKLPTSAALARGAQVRAEAPAGTHVAISMIPEAVVPDRTEIQVAQLQEATEQVTAVSKKALGVFSVVTPKFTRALFSGAQGASGIDAQGRATPLAIWRGTPVLDLNAPGAVRSVRFAQPPHHVLLAPP